MTPTQTSKNAWGPFLSKFHWQAFVTLTFRIPASDELGHSACHDWLTRLRSMPELSPNIYAFAGFERGRAGNLLHCHLLLGGLLPRRGQRPGLDRFCTLLALARAEWQHGRIDIQPYDSKRGAAWYVSKFPDGGEIVGRASKHRRRLPRAA